MNDQPDLGIGRQRPTPAFSPAQKPAQSSALQGDAVAAVQQSQSPTEQHEAASDTMQLDAAAGDYSLSVDDIRSRLIEIDITKSKDTIQRYCREGDLHCEKFGMLRRYFATEKSVDALIEKLKTDEAARTGTKVHEGARSDDDHALQVHEGAPENSSAEINDQHEAASTRTQIDAGADGMVDFLKDQVRVKDEQLKVKDSQIAAMLDRDHETNVLIKGLQATVDSTVGLLTGRQNQPDRQTVRDAEAHPITGEGDKEPGAGLADGV